METTSGIARHINDERHATETEENLKVATKICHSKATQHGEYVIFQSS